MFPPGMMASYAVSMLPGSVASLRLYSRMLTTTVHT
jgi:hypothetical protein